MADFITCVKYRLPIKGVMSKDGSLGQMEWEQMVFLGNPEYGCELEEITLRRLQWQWGYRFHD
jgi:pyruvate dehydrogenase (quinone)/pyruvate oxidase